MDYEVPVYQVDSSGTTVAVYVGHADGTVTTTTRDSSSPTGWAAHTPDASGTLVSASAPPPINPVPPLYAIVGGAGGAAMGGTINIAGGAGNGGITINWTSESSIGFSVLITVGPLFGGGTSRWQFDPDGRSYYHPQDGGPAIEIP